MHPLFPICLQKIHIYTVTDKSSLHLFAQQVSKRTPKIEQFQKIPLTCLKWESVSGGCSFEKKTKKYARHKDGRCLMFFKTHHNMCSFIIQ